MQRGWRLGVGLRRMNHQFIINQSSIPRVCSETRPGLTIILSQELMRFSSSITLLLRYPIKRYQTTCSSFFFRFSSSFIYLFFNDCSASKLQSREQDPVGLVFDHLGRGFSEGDCVGESSTGRGDGLLVSHVRVAARSGA